MVERTYPEHSRTHAILGGVVLSVYESQSQRVVVLKYGSFSSTEPILVRVHPFCYYGDTLRINDCDCRDQLNDTFTEFQQRGSGILLHLYQNQALGTDIGVERVDPLGPNIEHSDERPGLVLEEIDYSIAIDVLRQLGLNKIELLTNNRMKLDALATAGFQVTAKPLNTRITDSNVQHLRTKGKQFGRIADLPNSEGPNEGRPHCVVLGAAVTDHIWQIQRNPRMGKARQARAYLRRAGGKGLNQAIALARLGADTTLLTTFGHDYDAREIAAALAEESVRIVNVRTPDLGWKVTPQTAVFQPNSGAPTYVGWLGSERRILRGSSFRDHSGVIKASDAVVITLETADDAISQVVQSARNGSLVVLHASPAVEDPYELPTEVLEDVDVVVGSPHELAALLPGQRNGAPRKNPDIGQIARDLVEQCGVIVIVNDHRSEDRRVISVSGMNQEVVRVGLPRVREVGVPDAVGGAAVFCAAWTLAALAKDPSPKKRMKAKWRSDASPLNDRRNLIDTLVTAAGAEAWVTRSPGGYRSFPRRGPEFEAWLLNHHGIYEGDDKDG